MDNYAEFLHRLDAAAKSLTERREALGRVRSVVEAAFENNDYGRREWGKRLGKVEELMAARAVPDTGLQELHGVATNMQAMFRTRADRVGARLAAVDARISELDAPLQDLNLSKVKLTTSRQVAEERERLGQAMQNLAGTTEGANMVVPDAGLNEDLKKAREAVVLAEALLEVKGGQ
jgi:small-conductance mechanosensitive channel